MHVTSFAAHMPLQVIPKQSTTYVNLQTGTLRHLWRLNSITAESSISCNTRNRVTPKRMGPQPTTGVTSALEVLALGAKLGFRDYLASMMQTP